MRRATPILAALKSAEGAATYEDTVPRQIVSKKAADRADETDRVLEESMPKQFVSDPTFELGNSPERGKIVERIVAEKGQPAVDRQILLVRELLLPFATYAKPYVKAALGR